MQESEGNHKGQLQVNNLAISFKDEEGWVKAVDGISFSLKKGETLGIVGESGSGKSVSSLSVLRLLPEKTSRIDSGEIIYSAETGPVDLLRLSAEEIRKVRGKKIAMIFQEPMTSLNPVMRCGKQITESVMLHLKYNKKQAKEHTLKLFRDVLLPNPEFAFNAYPHELSGGQKQRVMIAMAISCSPEILIADEPTTALDVTVQKSILALLKDLQQRLNLSLIFISHDLGVIAQIADHVLVMNKGRIVEQGLTADIFNNPEQPYTKGLIACRPSMKVRLKKLPTVADFTDGEKTTVSKVVFEAEKSEERKNRHSRLYDSKPILKVQGLSVHYPLPKSWLKREREYFKAVEGVSFDVFKGETLGLVGESGCGKTTLGRAILRLVEPTAGNVLFEERDVTSLNRDNLRKMRRRMQIVFQDPYSSLNPRLTAGQAILEPMIAHNLLKTDTERKNKVYELLEKVDLKPSHFNRYPHQFSGGQRQRICIARALVLQPSLLICDESVSALDVSVQAQVLNLLNDLKKEFGFTYIFISHDLSVVRYMSDRMLVMRKGKIIEEGDADIIYTAPQNEYTKQLIEAIPKL
ncbi:MAG TPA: ABC transporter ATP-binding protein [Bacteroidales bacterium]|nr:ABC transporter ATP-binding protein [Bacteroidales bacterium]